MSKNLIPKIAKTLGVELGEEFKLKDNTGTLDSIALNSVYAFVEHDSFEGLVLTVSTGESRPLYMPPRPLEPIALKVFELLCRGKCEVVKIPWEPMLNEECYTFIKKLTAHVGVLFVLYGMKRLAILLDLKQAGFSALAKKPKLLYLR